MLAGDGCGVRSQPERAGDPPGPFGWDWTLLTDTDGGYGSWPPAQMEKLVNGQPGVTGWSTFAFTQIPIGNTEVPVLGLTRYEGSVQPPTTSGHPLSGPQQIELGTVTLRALGKHVGETVTVGSGRASPDTDDRWDRDLAVDGLGKADHVSSAAGPCSRAAPCWSFRACPRI